VSYEAIGRRYARAIFDIGKEEGQAASLSEDLQRFAEVWAGSTELVTVLENPLVAVEDREAIVLEIASRLGAKDTTKRALRLVTRNRRLRALPDIARHLSRMVDDDAQVVRAHVTSAAKVADSYLTRLRSEIERATGKKVVLESSVDPSLLGGIVTRIGDRVVDGSLRTRLAILREAALPAT
jgi:F-type H+-transporting ATPase subunit delta